MVSVFGIVHSHFQLSEVESEEILDEIYRLRVKAWRTKIAVADNIREWKDRFDLTSRHWAFFDNDRVIAAGRLTLSANMSDVPDPAVYKNALPDDLRGPIASLTRLVVDPEYFGRGLARPIDAVRVDAAEAAGCACIIGATHEPARLRQLQSIGFEALTAIHANTGESGIIAGTQPSAIIYLKLPRTTVREHL